LRPGTGASPKTERLHNTAKSTITSTVFVICMCPQVLENPLTQSLMSNPDIIRQMLESNPQMQVKRTLPYSEHKYSMFSLWVWYRYWYGTKCMSNQMRRCKYLKSYTGSFCKKK